MDTKITFRVNPDTIYKEISTEEWEAMEMAQDGHVRIYRLRPILARYVVGDDGNLLTQAAGMEVMRKLPLEDFLKDVFPAFFAALRDGAIPKGSGMPSPSPLPASTPAASPDGSTS